MSETMVFNPQSTVRSVENKAEKIIELIGSAVFDPTLEYLDPIPVLTQSGKLILARNDFSIVSGLEGTRKTWFVLSVAGAFYNDYLGFEKVDGGRLLWVDTEQSEGYLKKVVDRFFRITQIPRTDDRIKILTLREFRPKDRRDIIEYFIENHKPDLVVLDGGADLLPKGVNDEATSTEAIGDLMRWTEQNKCHIINVVHNTHGNDKTRGHYGSEALRKSGTAFLLKADGDVTHVTCVKSRDIRPDDFCFRINDDTILPELTTPPAKDGKIIKSENLFKQILPQPNSCNHASLVERIMNTTGKSDKTARRSISFALENGIIEKIGDVYSLVKNISDDDLLPF